MHALKANCQVLELFHGPTLAFKDFAARFMAGVMSYFMQERSLPVTILVATSGDTGSAVASAFYRVPGVRVVILYPSGKVSRLQEQQITIYGENITAVEIHGTFDDCQSLVKCAFQDGDLSTRLHLTSANSINVARLLPQSFYYIYAVSRMELERPVAISVPSGNFGNLTGGLLARKMGLPVSRFVAATNVNDIVPVYLKTGCFRPRPAVATLSNAMDVGNPSNFRRVQELHGCNHRKISQMLYGVRCTDEETKELMRRLWKTYGYLADPHSAVGYGGLERFLHETGGDWKGLFLATAHPAKFPETVKEATGMEVPLPALLRTCMEKPRLSVPLPADFSALKEFLISKFAGPL
jgi:threonine synthase